MLRKNSKLYSFGWTSTENEDDSTVLPAVNLKHRDSFLSLLTPKKLPEITVSRGCDARTEAVSKCNATAAMFCQDILPVQSKKIR